MENLEFVRLMIGGFETSLREQGLPEADIKPLISAMKEVVNNAYWFGLGTVFVLDAIEADDELRNKINAQSKEYIDEYIENHEAFK